MKNVMRITKHNLKVLIAACVESFYTAKDMELWIPLLNSSIPKQIDWASSPTQDQNLIAYGDIILSGSNLCYVLWKIEHWDSLPVPKVRVYMDMECAIQQ
jgi:hypothetical protein